MQCCIFNTTDGVFINIWTCGSTKTMTLWRPNECRKVKAGALLWNKSVIWKRVCDWQGDQIIICYVDNVFTLAFQVKPKTFPLTRGQTRCETAIAPWTWTKRRFSGPKSWRNPSGNVCSCCFILMETILNTYGILPSSVLLSLSENWEMFTWALAYGAVIARALPSVANWYSPDAHDAQGWTALGTKHTHVTACLPPRQFLIRDGLESVYCTRRVQIKDFEWVNIWKALFFF